MKRVFYSFMFLFLSFILYSQDVANCVIDSFKGKVLIYSNEKAKWILPEKGMILSEKDTVNTYNGRATLLFSNGSIIEIKENSIFSIKVFSRGKNEFNIWLGDLKAKVKKLLPGEKFIIYTPQAVCAVRGTEFEVSVSEDAQTKVKVFDGIVGVMDSEGLGKEVLVKKGQETLVVKGKPAFPAKPLEKEEIKKGEKETKKEKSKKQKETIGVEEVEIPEFKEEKKEKQKKSEAPSKGKNFNMYGNLGAVALTDPETGQTKVYYQLSLLPELSFGKLGIGLDLVFYFDENNNLRKGDWTWDKAWEKIAYIRWGRKYQDPFYILLGRFTRGVTIGNGFIVSNYSNMIQYPNIRRIGIEFALDRKKWGIEGMYSDMSLVHTWNDLKVSGFWSSRIYFRPLIATGLPLLNKLVIGGTYALDKEPDGVIDNAKDEVAIYGVDAGLPVLNSALFKIKLFSDLAVMDIGDYYVNKFNVTDKGKGFVYGLGGNILFLKYKFEYRTIDNNFIPNYFDTYYDIDRYKYYSGVTSTTTKAASYLSGKSKEPVLKGPLFRAGFNLMNGAITFSATYENFNVKPDDPYYPHLYAVAKIDKRVLMNQYQVEFTFDKRNVRTWSDLSNIKGPNTVLITKVGYSVANNVMVYMVYRQTFDTFGNPQKSTTIETRLSF